MFTAIEKEVEGTNMPLKQKAKWTKLLCKVAKASHDLGVNGKTKLEVTYVGV